MKILAIDYGDARTGLAACDETETLCTPLSPQIEEKSMNKAAAAVVERAQKEGAKLLLLGLPRNMDGTEGSRAKKSHKLADILGRMSGLPVVLWDERRTTVSAAAILSANDVFGEKRKNKLDAVSAAVLLESYLYWRRLHPGQLQPETEPQA